jgi:hypothetical protein
VQGVLFPGGLRDGNEKTRTVEPLRKGRSPPGPQFWGRAEGGLCLSWWGSMVRVRWSNLTPGPSPGKEEGGRMNGGAMVSVPVVKFLVCRVVCLLGGLRSGVLIQIYKFF